MCSPSILRWRHTDAQVQRILEGSCNTKKVTNGNRLFQKDLDAVLQADPEYIQGVLHKEERTNHLLAQRSGKSPSTAATVPAADKSKNDRLNTSAKPQEDPTKASVGTHCDGCGRPGHTKEECRLNTHPGRTQGIQAHGRHPVLSRLRRADGAWLEEKGGSKPTSSITSSFTNRYGPGGNTKDGGRGLSLIHI